MIFFFQIRQFHLVENGYQFTSRVEKLKSQGSFGSSTVEIGKKEAVIWSNKNNIPTSYMKDL